jgi:hypothetical protein
MGSPEEQSKRDTWLSPSTVLLLCVGILVPITAALIPAAIRHFKTHDFRYSITGPVTVGNRTAFAINVRNRGLMAEKNVEIWLPKIRPDQEFEFEMRWAPAGTKMREESNYKVFSLGDLQPEQRARISITTAAAFAGDEVTVGTLRGEALLPLMTPRIVSADGIAEFVLERRGITPMEYAYRIGFWGFVILVVSAILWALTSSKLGRRLLRVD